MSKAWASLPMPSPHVERTRQMKLSHVVGLPRVWLRRIRCRSELSALTPEQMRDTGLSPKMVRNESRKPFWRA